MSALPYVTIHNVLEALSAQCVNAMEKQPLYLTAADFTEAFIRPEHVTQLTEVFDLVGGAASIPGTELNIPTDPTDEHARCIARVNFFKSPKLLIPMYAFTGTMNHGTTAAEKVKEWAMERRRLGLLLGDAKDALEALNEMCSTAKGLSLVFPALPAIMVRSSEDEGDRLVQRGHKVMQGKVIGTMPTLPREVIDRIRSAAALLQAIFMTEDAEVPTAPQGTVVRISGRMGNHSTYSRPHIINPERKTDTFI